MKWIASAISIRFVDRTSPSDAHANSGVHLALVDAGQTLLQYNLTVNVLPHRLLSRCDPYITTTDLIDHKAKEVTWVDARVDFNLPITEEDGVEEFLSYFKNNGFSLLPLGQVSSSLKDFGILNLTTQESVGSASNTITFADTRQYEPIDIVSFPFSFSNPLLFSNYRASGNINFISNFGYLTDVKYIDNMVGAMVLTKHDGVAESLGLVMTNLRKFNGDGDLMFILSWKVIWAIVARHHPNNHLITKPVINKLVSTSPMVSASPARDSVLPVLVSLAYKQSWGSCVVLNSEYLVTNFHVIKPFVQNKAATILVHLDASMVMDLGEEDEINTTFKDLDLCFIRLSLTNQFKLRSAGKVPATYTRAYDVGDMVKTTGYGLFFNPKYLQPIESYGRIMVKQHLKLQDTDSHTTPVLVVTSASCWNGSSGGGLFKDEKLVGLICSNAQIKVHNPNTNDFHTEKLPKLCFILPVEVVLACFAVATQSYREFGLNLEVKNAWNLVDNHRTRFAAKL